MRTTRRSAARHDCTRRHGARDRDAPAARDTLARARRAHDSLDAVVRAAEAALPDAGRSRLAARGACALRAGGAPRRTAGAVRHGAASRDARADLAGAHEAERTSGWPVVAVVREALIDGPARYRPTGVDPFRMLYLGLTATGTRSRTAIVTGADPVMLAAVGGRLAIAAAADHRTTLVVDLDPSQIALSRTFRERAGARAHRCVRGGVQMEGGRAPRRLERRTADHAHPCGHGAR